MENASNQIKKGLPYLDIVLIPSGIDLESVGRMAWKLLKKRLNFFYRNSSIEQKTGQNEIKDLCPAGLVFYLALVRVTGHIILKLMKRPYSFSMRSLLYSYLHIHSNFAAAKDSALHNLAKVTTVELLKCFLNKFNVNNFSRALWLPHADML